MADMCEDEARTYKCNACGKGFARVDVLKKHEAVACKMLRPYGHPDPPSNAVASSSRPNSSAGPSRHQGYAQPPTTARIRIKESQQRSRANSPVEPNNKRQKRDQSVETSLSSSEEDEVEPDTPYDRRFSTDTIQTGHHHLPPQPPPHHHPGLGHEYHHHPDEQMHPYGQAPHRSQAISDTRWNSNPGTHLPPVHTVPAPSSQYPLISPTQKDMSMSLAPAYAPTPDVSDIPGDSAPIRINTDIQSMPATSHAMPDYQQPLSAHAPPGPGNASVEWESVGGGGNGSDFGMPAKVGENMDDLLGWLFNTNAPGTGGDWSFGMQQGQLQQDMQGQQFLPTFSIDPKSAQNSMSVEAFNFSPVDPHDTSQGYPPTNTSHQTQTQQWIPPSQAQEVYPAEAAENGSSLRNGSTDQHRYSQSSSSTAHRRYPQAFHPLYVPNIPGKTSIPNFSGSEKILIQGREKYKEVIDDEVHEAMLDMFEVRTLHDRRAGVWE